MEVYPISFPMGHDVSIFLLTSPPVPESLRIPPSYEMFTKTCNKQAPTVAQKY